LWIDTPEALLAANRKARNLYLPRMACPLPATCAVNISRNPSCQVVCITFVKTVFYSTYGIIANRALSVTRTCTESSISPPSCWLRKDGPWDLKRHPQKIRGKNTTKSFRGKQKKLDVMRFDQMVLVVLESIEFSGKDNVSESCS
jgi:hypothetical protein